MWIWCSFSREKGFSLNHFLLARNLGKDILPNATNRDVTMLLERDGGEGGQGEQWSYLTLTSLSHEHRYRKKCPSKDKGTPFFQQIQRVPSWLSGVCVLMYRSRSLCLLIRRAVSKMHWFAFKHRFGDMPTTETIHCETFVKKLMSWLLNHAQQKPIVKSFIIFLSSSSAPELSKSSCMRQDSEEMTGMIGPVHQKVWYTVAPGNHPIEKENHLPNLHFWIITGGMTLECWMMRYAVVSHHGRDPIHVDPPTLDSHGMVNQVIEDRATLPKTKSKPPLKMPEDCNPKGSRIYSSKQENVHRRCMLVLGSAHLLRMLFFKWFKCCFFFNYLMSLFTW